MKCKPVVFEPHLNLSSQSFFCLIACAHQSGKQAVHTYFFHESIFSFFIMYRILIDVSHLSASLNHFVQTHPLTTAIINQMNNVLSMLQSIVYKVHSIENLFSVQ